MSRIFISHSSANNAAAIALRDWLQTEGWDDVFLDLDPERGIVAGERWERALNEAANRCEAVIFLVTRAWLGSRWCLKELNLAHRLNKRLFGVLVEDIPIAEVPPDLTSAWQLVNLAAGSDAQPFRAVTPDKAVEEHVYFSKSGLARLKGGLSKAGLDARFFAWPPAEEPNRPPYRGLKPLETEDAGIFFGREAPVIQALDILRGLAEATPPRFLVVLGASGAGKSSFLRAGLLPRLTRDDRNFLPLPIIRPDRAVLTGETGLVRSLDAAFQAQGSRRARADVKTAIDGGAQTLLPLLVSIAENARPPSLPDLPAPKPPVLVLSIDQGEELFLAEGAEEAEKFLSLLKDLLTAATPDVITLVTIRSDSYERLQLAKPLEGVNPVPMSLPPVPQGSYADIIEGPARRLNDTPRALKIEPALTQALLTDIEEGGAKDALPLLAFTLERLYADYGGDGNLKLSEYEQLGGVKGSIEAAVESALIAADADPTIPKDRASRLALLRRAFPLLAGIDLDTGSSRRRVARRSEIPGECLPLVNLLVEQRLLATDVAKDSGEVTIEPAHEALLRQWGLLQTWLVEDSAALAALESVKRAARDWEASGKDASWLTHGGGRLEDAERLRLRPDLAGLLAADDWAYLAACRAREAEEKEREERRRKRELFRNRIIAYGSLAALAIVSVLGWFFWQQKQEAVAQRMRAEGTVIAAAQGADQFIIDVAAKLRETAGLPLALVGEFLKNAAKMLDQLHQYNADSPELARSRARFLREMSQTLLAANDTDSALASAEQSRDMVEKLFPQNPNDANLRHELSLAYNRIGEALSRKDRRVEALGYFRRALAIREELAAADPTVEAQRDLALSYERTGDELFDSDVDEASKLYEKSFAIRERLAAAEPDNSDRREDIAVAYERLARAARKRGNDGLLLYRKILAIREALVNADPGNARFLANLGTTYDTLGAILADEMGRCDEALDSLHKALSIRQGLAAKAPDNVDWQAKLAKSMYRLSVCDDPSEDWLTRASVILVKLDKDGKLPDDARDLLARIEMRLRATSSSNPKPKL